MKVSIEEDLNMQWLATTGNGVAMVCPLYLTRIDLEWNSR